MAIGTVTCSALTALVLASGPAPTLGSTSQGLSFAPFGALTLYRPAGPPTSVALFASGDGGWTLGVIGMAERLRARGALVVGFNVRTYLRNATAAGACTYAAADFEALSHYVQHALGLPRHLPPVLIGYSSGATLVYIALAQSPPNTFAGAMSLGFCADLDGSARWCPGSGELHAAPLARPAGSLFQPVAQLPAPWILLHGEEDQVCAATSASKFAVRIPQAELVQLPGVGHGFGVAARWGTAFDAAFQRIVTAPATASTPAPGAIGDLPLVEVPAPNSLPAGRFFAVMLSGDGGWAGIDREVAHRLAAGGIPVVGMNSLRYFWTAKSPAVLGRDLTRIIELYQQRWKRDHVLLLGYSFGADVLPLAIAALPAPVRARVAGVGLLGLGTSATFEFHFTDWVGKGNAGGQPMGPALKALPGLIGGAPVACVFGARESATGCHPTAGVELVRMPGGHNLGGDAEGITARLLSVLAPDQR
jgi:type IV secretory pathway VirJ component